MPRVRVRDLELEVESFGDESAPAVLLVMGLGGQLIRWDEDLCEGLAGRGLRVVRYDHRDVGLSDRLDSLGDPDLGAVMRAAASGEAVDVPYRLEDLADDAVGVLDALAIERAHVVGTSMGGMVAQLVALRNPERMRTLVSMMSTTGSRDLPPPKPEAIAHLMKPEPDEREANIEHQVEGSRLMGGSLPFDEDFARRRAARIFDRGHYPAGRDRHIAASIAAGCRRGALSALRVPTLVLHGDEDPLVVPECGVDTAEAIPGARLQMVPRMGHDLRPALWPILVDAIAGHAERG